MLTLFSCSFTEEKYNVNNFVIISICIQICVLKFPYLHSENLLSQNISYAGNQLVKRCSSFEALLHLVFSLNNFVEFLCITMAHTPEVASRGVL